MSCKSAIYASNSNSQVLAVNDVVNFGTIIRRFGCNTNLSGGNVVITGSGYYRIDSNFIITPTTEGNLTIKLFKDGVEIPLGISEMTVAVGNIISSTIPVIIRHVGCSESIITAEISGVPTTITNASISIEKI